MWWVSRAVNGVWEHIGGVNGLEHFISCWRAGSALVVSSVVENLHHRWLVGILLAAMGHGHNSRLNDRAPGAFWLDQSASEWITALLAGVSWLVSST